MITSRRKIIRNMKFLAIRMGMLTASKAKAGDQAEETMKRFGLAGPMAAATMTAVLALTGGASAQSKFQCEPGETYIMNVMVSAHPYWVPVYQGFKQAAEAMGCETIFSGTPDYDITKQIASFEQDLVKNPAGILLHPMQSDPFIEPINRAIDSGVEVVTFAADSPKSKRTTYITSDNLAEAKFAAEEIVKQVGDSAEYAVLENPGQSNHDLRVTALIDYMAKNYPNMKLVGRQATNQDSNAAYRATASILQANPNLAAIWIPEAGSAEGAVAAQGAAWRGADRSGGAAGVGVVARRGVAGGGHDSPAAGPP
jgi:ribose transport system substrate-binding protein